MSSVCTFRRGQARIRHFSLHVHRIYFCSVYAYVSKWVNTLKQYTMHLQSQDQRDCSSHHDRCHSRAIEFGSSSSDSDTECSESDFCCPICLDTFREGDVAAACASFNCGHAVCAVCLTDFLTYRVVREGDSYPTCHLAFCDSVASNCLLERHVAPEVFRLAVKRQKQRQVRGIDGLPLFCQNAACPSTATGRPRQPLGIPPLSSVGEAAYITRCAECERETCVRCGGAAHYGEQCKRSINHHNRGYLFRTGSQNANTNTNENLSGNHANSFWGHFAFCSRCLATTHFDDDADTGTCCGEEVVVLRTQGDFYRLCRKLSWRLFLMYTLRSDFKNLLARFAVVHIINLWIAFSIITWRRPLLLLLSLVLAPSALAKLYNIGRAGLTLGFNYLRVFSEEPTLSPASSRHEIGSGSSIDSIEIDIDMDLEL